MHQIKRTGSAIVFKCFIILFSLLISNQSFAAKRRALVFGIDGLRGDALQKLMDERKVPAIAGLAKNGQYAKCPDSDAKTCARAHDGNDFDSDFVWKTGPGWGSVISGLNAKRHQIASIGHKNMSVFSKTTKEYPTIFRLLKSQGKKVAAAGVGAFLTSKDGDKTYPGITDYECGAGEKGPEVQTSDTSSCNLDFRYALNNRDENRDQKIRDAAMSWINNPEIDLVMIVLDQVDSRGHEVGFDLEKEYLKALANADAHVRKVVEKIKSRVQKNQEDWLVVLTSDHGGHNQSSLIKWIPGLNKGIHGSKSGKDNIVPFIVNVFSSNPFKGYVAMENKENVRHFDTFKTLAQWFGLGSKTSVAKRDGQSWVR